MLCCREATALQQHLLSHHVGNIAVCLTVCSHHYNNFDKKNRKHRLYLIKFALDRSISALECDETSLHCALTRC